MIFTCDSAEIRSLDRGQVLTFLTHECTAAVVPYLEHIIYNWNEDAPKFHEALGQHYISKVKQLQRDYISILGEDEHVAPAGEEEGELGEYRCKLQRFLQTSTAYSPEKLLVQLRHNCKFYRLQFLLFIFHLIFFFFIIYLFRLFSIRNYILKQILLHLFQIIMK
ncbi:unnamed protein product [Brugia pahangi]|uniref:THO complex subunit 2 n=1 Tax=Brugia pahangi TaxID=6280 RepID=A0A0N4THW9_BRUPA|nr:unnamed protein product [Brugia pahangi]